jgi:V8-like Glu-specific endopeptidase
MLNGGGTMKTILMIFAFVYAGAAFAIPEVKGPRPLFPHPAASNYDFEGVVALNNCSGSLVKFENQPDTDKAYVLTNGHCVESGFPAPGTVLVNRPSTRSFTLLNANATDAGRIRATTLVYGTMTKTDAALYRVNETYAEILKRFNIRPLTMGATHPTLQTPIQVISGYWRRGYSCNIDFFVHRLLEGQWEWSDSIRYSNPGCEVIGGTSGSPVVATGTRTVVGVNNTGNESGRKCTDNNPCEIDEKGTITYQEGLSYGQQTYWFYSCLNKNFEIDLNTAGCELFH